MSEKVIQDVFYDFLHYMSQIMDGISHIDKKFILGLSHG